MAGTASRAHREMRNKSVKKAGMKKPPQATTPKAKKAAPKMKKGGY